MKNVFMIFAKNDLDNSCSDKKFRTREAAEQYVKYVLEPNDKAAGVYEPNYFEVVDMSLYYN